MDRNTKEEETAMTIYLDTHVVLWLYEGLLKKLTRAGRKSIEENDLLISPMVRLELQYLFEIRRSTQPANAILGELRPQIGLTVCDLPFDQVAHKASELTWTRDPFDRLIVAQAIGRNFQLLTKDREIRRNTELAFWS